MAGIDNKNLDNPDDTDEFVHGRALVVRIGDEEVSRSELQPGWNWDEDLEPYAEGRKELPLTHREYVVSGKIRYLMEDGTEEIGSPGDFLFIQPDHRGWVVGDEP